MIIKTTNQQDWFTPECLAEIKIDLENVVNAENNEEAIEVLQMLRTAYNKEALQAAAKELPQEARKHLKYLVETIDAQIKEIDIIVEKLKQVIFVEDYYDLNLINKQILNKAWEKTPHYIKRRIEALCDGTIKQIKNFKFKIPSWCSFAAGELIAYQDKIYWFSNVPMFVELTGSQKKLDKTQWINLILISQKYEINAKFKDCKSF